MSTNASTATAVPHPPHQNAIAKKAFGKHDWLVYEMTKDLNASDAIKKIEITICRCASDEYWKPIITKPEHSGQHVGYLSYWMDGVYGLTDQGNNSKDVAIGYHAMALIQDIIVVLTEKTQLNDDVFRFLSELTCRQIIRNIPSDEAAALLKQYLGLANIEPVSQLSKILYGSIFAALKEKWKPVGQIDWLIQTIRDHKIKCPGLVSLLWEEEAKIIGTYFDVNSCHDILKPWIEFAEIDRHSSVVTPYQVVQSCVEHQVRVIKFAKDVNSLEWAINQNVYVVVGSIECNMASLTITRIILNLQTSHYDFCSKSVPEQRSLAIRCTAEMQEYLRKWTKDNQVIINECLILGTLRQKLEREVVEEQQFNHSIL